METSIKNQNEQPKAKTSNQRHLTVLVFEIELIVSQKQERATNAKWKHASKTKTSNKKQQRTFFISIFIHLLQLWTYARWLTSGAMKRNNEKKEQQ